jgi:hypothetical protein
MEVDLTPSPVRKVSTVCYCVAHVSEHTGCLALIAVLSTHKHSCLFNSELTSTGALGCVLVPGGKGYGSKLGLERPLWE